MHPNAQIGILLLFEVTGTGNQKNNLISYLCKLFVSHTVYSGGTWLSYQTDQDLLSIATWSQPGYSVVHNTLMQKSDHYMQRIHADCPQ
jgi:hypothetical protein